MARKRRIQTPNLLRHVMSRGNGKMKIFLDDVDYVHFLGLLEEVVDKFSIRCWNYCLMPNHYHLALYPTLPNFSRAMQKLNGDYAGWWNRRHSHVGHVVQGRPKAQIVDTGEYLLTLSRYIARNPVRAGLVASPEDWPWSSYSATVGFVNPPPFLTFDPVLAPYGTDPTVARVRYAAHVLGPNGDAAAEDRIRSNAVILGDRTFRRRVEAEHEGAPARDDASDDRTVVVTDAAESGQVAP